MGYQTHRALLVLVSILLGIIAALVTGMLVVGRDGQLISGFLAGGGAFVVTVPLALLIERELGLFDPAGR